MRRVALWLVLAAFVGAGLGVAGTHLFPRDSWALGKIAARPWDRVVAGRSARTAQVVYGDGVCSRFDHAETETRGELVVITVFERTRRLAKNEGCPLGMVRRVTAVALSEPIETRAVVDGACSRSNALGLGVCRTDEPEFPPCVLMDSAAACVPSGRLGPDGRLLSPLAPGQHVR